MKFWMKAGKLIADVTGKILDCVECMCGIDPCAPCPTDTYYHECYACKANVGAEPENFGCAANEYEVIVTNQQSPCDGGNGTYILTGAIPPEGGGYDCLWTYSNPPTKSVTMRSMGTLPNRDIRIDTNVLAFGSIWSCRYLLRLTTGGHGCCAFSGTIIPLEDCDFPCPDTGICEVTAL